MSSASIHTRGSLVLCSLLALPVTAALGPSSERIGKYDFAYQIQAHSRVSPVQVFDDGQNTYFQFLGGGAIPAIFRITESGPELTAQSFDGPYLRVEGVAAQYTLRLGSAAGRVTYTAGGRPTFNETPVASLPPQAAPQWKQLVASTQPVAFTPSEARPTAIDTNSYATPTKGDIIDWNNSRSEKEDHEIVFSRGSDKLTKTQIQRLERIASSLSGEFSIVITGRDDDSLKEGLGEARARAIAHVFSKKGVAQSRIEGRLGGQTKAGDGWACNVSIVKTVKTTPIRLAQQVSQPTPAALEVPPEGFTLLPSDRNLAGVINRWARVTSYQVVWEATEMGEPEITGTGKLTAASMKEAMEVLVNGMRAKGYDVAVTIYKNRVIRIAKGGRPA